MGIKNDNNNPNIGFLVYSEFMMQGKITKKRISEDEIEIYVDGKYIDYIYYGWFRLGGAGWTFSGINHTYKTQKECIERLLKGK